MSQNPIILLSRAFRLLVSGRIRLPGVNPADGFEDKGEVFIPFRKVSVKPKNGQSAGAIFRVRFSFKNLSAAANRRLSLIPIPFILAQPGFRSKTWLLGQASGDFIGYYEFESVQAAKAYWNSLPLRMMRRRAAPGTLSHEVREIQD